jgi:hypothetical protein
MAGVKHAERAASSALTCGFGGFLITRFIIVAVRQPTAAEFLSACQFRSCWLTSQSAAAHAMALAPHRLALRVTHRHAPGITRRSSLPVCVPANSQG